MTKTPHRAHNFNAGPGAMPLAVLEQARDELVEFHGQGMSLMEMSHRSKTYEDVHARAIDSLRGLLGIDDRHVVLLMQGGARALFATVPMNLLGKGFAEYVVTGVWSEMALEEARRVGDARAVWSSAAGGHRRVPQPGEVRLDPKAAYVHLTSNNTIYGTQWSAFPQPKAPLVCDMSSDLLSRPIDVAHFDLIYAGAQKNMGPAGVTAVIMRRELIAHSPPRLPDVWSFARVAESNSLLNTPPVFSIYMMGLVLDHVRKEGGVPRMAERNRQKADLLYRTIDDSGGYYRGHAEVASRSQMNVTFRLPDERLEKQFLEAAVTAELVGLKGHRSVGGLRASLYNAVPLSSVEVLCEFMREFARTHG